MAVLEELVLIQAPVKLWVKVDTLAVMEQCRKV
jgi:hypothetical protein